MIIYNVKHTIIIYNLKNIIINYYINYNIKKY